MNVSDESIMLEKMLDLQLNTRKYLLVYETLDGKSGLISSDSDVPYLIHVLLATVKKLENGEFK